MSNSTPNHGTSDNSSALNASWGVLSLGIKYQNPQLVGQALDLLDSVAALQPPDHATSLAQLAVAHGPVLTKLATPGENPTQVDVNQTNRNIAETILKPSQANLAPTDKKIPPSWQGLVSILISRQFTYHGEGLFAVAPAPPYASEPNFRDPQGVGPHHLLVHTPEGPEAVPVRLVQARDVNKVKDTSAVVVSPGQLLLGLAQTLDLAGLRNKGIGTEARNAAIAHTATKLVLEAGGVKLSVTDSQLLVRARHTLVRNIRRYYQAHYG